MAEELPSTKGDLRRFLDRAEVLKATVMQLRKDLGEEGIPLPPADDAAFEAVRSAVLGLVEGWHRTGSTDLSRAINRVDLTERMVDDAVERGGLPELAGTMVQRCLLKVLLRERFAGRG